MVPLPLAGVQCGLAAYEGSRWVIVASFFLPHVAPNSHTPLLNLVRRREERSEKRIKLLSQLILSKDAIPNVGFKLTPVDLFPVSVTAFDSFLKHELVSVHHLS